MARCDTLIRKLTNNQKSLNDFEHVFLGKGGDTGPLIVPYTREELVADLNSIAPYDWAKFLHDRVDVITPRADVSGIEQGGYRLIYTDKPNASQKKMTSVGGRRASIANCWYSVGFRAGADGVISDVRWNSPADKSGLAPLMKIIAINDRVFSADALSEAIKQAKGTTDPIHFIVQVDSFISTLNVDYHDGERFPVLQRIDGTPAYLDDITKPLTKPEVVPESKEN